MSQVLVIGQGKGPLDPVHPSRIRKLLLPGQAAVYRRFLFVLSLKRPISEPSSQLLRLKSILGAELPLNKARRRFHPSDKAVGSPVRHF